MKHKPSKISTEDAELFREMIGKVRPIETKAEPAKPEPPAPEPRQFAADEAKALRESHQPPAAMAILDAADLLSYRRPEVSERLFKQFKRGEFSIQDEIDLHHLRATDAEILLKRFLNEAHSDARRCVLVIHGKGLRSEGTPVLKSLVDRVLRQRGDVLAFASAPLNQGGTGAVLVLLDRR